LNVIAWDDSFNKAITNEVIIIYLTLALACKHDFDFTPHHEIRGGT